MKNNKLKKLISNRINYYRKSNNLTIEALAYNSGLSKGGLSDILNYKKCANIDTITKLCAGLHISIIDFFNFDEIREYIETL